MGGVAGHNARERAYVPAPDTSAMEGERALRRDGALVRSAFDDKVRLRPMQVSESLLSPRTPLPFASGKTHPPCDFVSKPGRPVDCPPLVVRAASSPVDGDIVHFGRTSPVVAGNWTVNVAPAAAARKLTHPPAGWGAIWAKAIALAARKWPELRSAYMPYPWPHLYLHPHAVVTLVVEREWNGRPAVFFDQIRRPEDLSLTEIDIILKGLRKRPVESVGGYRRLIRFSRLPWIIRRPVWSFALKWSGRMRSCYFGTFSVHSFPVRGAQVMQSTTPISFSLIYGLPDADGNVLLQLMMDHRIVDGLTSHRIVRAIEAAMREDIVAELTAAGSGGVSR
jgi:hypothetical protein